MPRESCRSDLTNALVSLGAVLFVGLSMLTERSESDPNCSTSRERSGISGWRRNTARRLNVRGLNRAATSWFSGAVGSLAGAGFPLEAMMGTLSVLGIHLGLKPLGRIIDLRTKSAFDVETYYRLRVEPDVGQEVNLRQMLLCHVNGHEKLTLQGLSTEETDAGRSFVIADIFSLERNDRAMEEIVARVSIEPEVKSVSWQRTTA